VQFRYVQLSLFERKSVVVDTLSAFYKLVKLLCLVDCCHFSLLLTVYPLYRELDAFCKRNFRFLFNVDLSCKKLHIIVGRLCPFGVKLRGRFRLFNIGSEPPPLFDMVAVVELLLPLQLLLL